MARITVPDSCYSVRMGDGTVYPVRNGHADLSDKHSAQMRKSDAKNGYDLVMESVGPRTKLPDNFCSACLFNNVSWRTDCVHCGQGLN